MMPLNNLGTDPEANASAKNALGAEKSFENPVLRFRTHTATVIGNCDHHAFAIVFPVAPVTASQQQSALLLWQSVDGICDQIVQHLPDLSLKAGNASLRLFP